MSERDPISPVFLANYFTNYNDFSSKSFSYISKGILDKYYFVFSSFSYDITSEVVTNRYFLPN